MTLEKLTKIVMLLFIVSIVFGLTSCKTKEKTIEREKQKSVSELKEKGIDKTINDIKIDSFAKKGSSLIKINENQSLELTQADPNKKIIVEDSNGNKLHITGANAILKNNKETATKKDTSDIALSKLDKSKLDKFNETEKKDSKESVFRKAYSYVKTTPTWLWVTVGFLGLVVIIAFVFKKRISFIK